MGMEAGAPGPSSRKRKASAHEAPAPAPTAVEAPGAEPTAEDREPPLSGADGDGGGAGGDRISDLPDAVLGDIVSLLPTKEGARTQVLASRWRHLWRSAPLSLDHRYFLFDEEGLDVAISRVLAAHLGPGRRFCAPVYHLPGDRADAWLRSPALDNLQELELCSFSYMLPYPPPTKQLPPSAAFRFSDTLLVFTIGDCHLTDDITQVLHFPKLQKLALKRVLISESSLHIMIAACPALECLLIRKSSGFRCVRINSISLRSIGVSGYSPRGLNFEELIIENAPCLESLLILGSCECGLISVISAPKLEALGYLSSHYGTRISFDSTVIERLSVDRLTTAVCTVKILAVDMHALSLDTVLDLMGCFPCLEKLYIQSTGPGNTNFWRRKHRTLIRSLDIRLKTIVWRCYRGIKSHADFATFFVLNAGVLELMTFEVDVEDFNEEFCAQHRKMLQVDSRASRGARIRFTSDWSYKYHMDFSIHDLGPADPFERTYPLKGDITFVLC
ncbi:hypothetical protein CFC21_008685 [Triticum aestivum]|uniref:FBD domain-containing protein n=3 Tax=Triticum TaxID=4564 RepID=A0A9R0R3B9_TRITD|nr:F-box/FBD/LRR-repeat protein At2g04230-like [Triticum aestivum]KAF6991618.1 hypothetical protein CFC21_008685 [Triticum aestivum]VAH22328.1 unnamed protein product [Triticum turgidum subsp. durum]